MSSALCWLHGCNLAMQGDRPPIFIRTNRLDDLDLARLSEEQRPRIFYLLGILKALNGFMRMIWSIAGQHPDSKAVFGGQTALTYITRGSGYSAKYKANRSMPVELGIYEVRRDNAGLRNKVVMSLMEVPSGIRFFTIARWPRRSRAVDTPTHLLLHRYGFIGSVTQSSLR